VSVHKVKTKPSIQIQLRAAKTMHMGRVALLMDILVAYLQGFWYHSVQKSWCNCDNILLFKV